MRYKRVMRIAILGAGPAGLYLSYLIKRRRPDADIVVIEQNAAAALAIAPDSFITLTAPWLPGPLPKAAADSPGASCARV